MLKPKLLRQEISRMVPWVRANPDRLALYVPRGHVVGRGGASASFEYRYTLEVLVMDFPGSTDDIMLPIQLWARQYEPELLFNPDNQKNGITFEVDILNNDAIDLLVKIQVTEAVAVTSANGKPVVRHRADAPPDLMEGMDGWAIAVRDMSSTVSGDAAGDK
ncbi:phage tail protein [Musicola keenii]|uniref:phage tail protein n=1 Tax=Musicola keenii TaxID=2884250 RepID=UPI00177DE7DB|nr:phage tail protein [Musicola keenii]